MKTKFFYLTLIFMLVAGVAQANDYLEKKKHYMVYSAGMDKIHFKVPVWSYGRYNNYYLGETSRIYYVKDGKEFTIANVCSDRYDENDEDSDKGTAYVKLAPGMGSITVTSIADGTPYYVRDNGEWTPKLYVIQKEDDDHKHVTFLEFDWYLPSTMYGKGDITIKERIYVYKSSSGSQSYDFDWDFGKFSPGNTLNTPQLYTPFLYTLNENGPTGYGNAAIPYSVFYEPKSYTTSVYPKDTIVLGNNERAGNIYVATSDTVIEQVYANFSVVYNAAGDTTTQRSIAIDIPPYHRIYDFKAIEETDSTGTFTGNNVLEWRIKNPDKKDIVDGDHFELQRATKSDFSDVQTLEIIPLSRHTNGTYRFSDQSREIWTGNAVIENDTSLTENKVSVDADHYLLRDENGNPLCNVDLHFSTDMIIQPSVPVYYRIRRASSAIWGWAGHEFAKEVTMQKHNFLAPLSDDQESYVLDPDYRNNHKVHFRIHIDNANVQFNVPQKEFFKLTYDNVTMPKSADGMVKLTVTSFFSEAEISITDVDNGQAIVPTENLPLGNKTYSIPEGSRVTVRYPAVKTGSTVTQWSTNTYEVNYNSTISILYKYGFGYITGTCYCDTDRPSETDIVLALDRVENHLWDSLYQVISSTIHAAGAELGKCMWDRTARLILSRTTVETGQTVDLIIPNDSIRRQADGSWIATMSDVASAACTHYTYSVRIDQSASDLRLCNPSAQLLPKTIEGPELYYDEGATITEFTATKGATESPLKQGVLLNWRASSTNVDEYLLLRLEKGSDHVPDTLYTGIENTYFDRTAIPDKHYEYTISALYQCNSKKTVNSASTEGWRTPYGEISGAILMSDNSGIPQVTVALQQDGQIVRTMVTGADGAFRFDSLAYDPNTESGTQYVVVPTAAYGSFVFNYTTMPTATVSLTINSPLATDIQFQNTEVVRLSGRVLYKGSTIPVAGAMFRLNNDTIRRGNAPLTTSVDGTFELILTKGQSYSLQVFKDGHSFEGDGILRVDGDNETFALDKALDGVRFYDTTKVRLVGRVAGGNDQRDLPEAFGLGKNNLGDDLQLVLQLEGDNTAQIVHDPDDLTRDTVQQRIAYDAVGGKTALTRTLFEKKRITIRPDTATGEYAVDLFPVKYKVVQATARGYATLFGSGQGSETFDLTNAPKDSIRATYLAALDSVEIALYRDGKRIKTDTVSVRAPRGTLRDRQSVTYNAVYDRIYHSPAKIHMTQLIYGMEKEGLGEPTMLTSAMTNDVDTVPLYTLIERTNHTKVVQYLLGYPVYINKRSYQFTAAAYEEYYYNNDSEAGALTRVPLRGGKVRIHNGLHSTGAAVPYNLDEQGRCTVLLTVDNLDVTFTGNMALRTVTAALEYEDNVVESEVFRGYITGEKLQSTTLHATEADINVLDIVRNPGGTGSNAWVESGATYHYSYKENYKWEFGMELDLKFGTNVTADVGVMNVAGVAGSYVGSSYSASRQLVVPIPFVHKWDWGYQYDYTVTTTERISTASSGSVYNFGGLADASAGVGYGVGGMADVFFGTTTSMLSGKAKSVTLINDSVYQFKLPAIKAGTMHVIAQGTTPEGKRYYLVNAEKVVLGSKLGNTFVYSQYYILYTLLPRLIMERQNLLSYYADETTAQQAANHLGKPVYWVQDTSVVSRQDTLKTGYYKMLTPNNQLFNDEVKALDRMIYKWMEIIYQNEQEKVYARMAGKREGTYSVSFGNTYSRTDTYSSVLNHNNAPFAGLWGAEVASTGLGVATGTAHIHQALLDFISKSAAETTVGYVAEKYLRDYYTVDEEGNRTARDNVQQIGAADGRTKFDFSLTPVLTFNQDLRQTMERGVKKNCGFTLVPDAYGDITVSVYRAPLDKAWGDTTRIVRTALGISSNNDSLLYGSYVFYTEAGATFCPYEGEVRTAFYSPGTLLGNATVPIAEPELTANTYEVAHVQPDQPAYIRIELRNNGQMGEGRLSDFRSFELGMVNASNADGLEVYADGNSLAAPIPVNILPGQPVYKTLKIMRGAVDDYNDLKLRLYVASCPKNYSDMSFSVHFMPQSSPVSIMAPRANWVMNTLSPRDSAGYYLPVEIGDFDLNKKNFDHIEFQYKLSSQSDEMWVNLCSFYASDSLYDKATGNKAMIENGKIAPFRFYGEKDPIEQKYDLRAVSFCRYGTGFVSKSSPVITGVKDTRPPRVFGEPEPVNAILGVGDNLKLRFNEPIAGNYLDEDNNFQIKGVTNTTGITSGTSIHFDGTENSFAMSQVDRSLKNTSFTIDLMVKPAGTNRRQVFFSHSDEQNAIEFGINEERKLFLRMNEYVITSLPVDPMLEFTRVCVVLDNTAHIARFYVGTKDMTDPVELHLDDFVVFNVSAPICLGRGYEGNMLEMRLWLKALTQEEIAATHLRQLTGYERELVAYYPLNEGLGSIAKDRANGAHLTLKGATWNLPSGISVHLSNQDSLMLASNLLSRSIVYDATYMFWFRTSGDGYLFRAGRVENDSVQSGVKMAVEKGALVLYCDSNQYPISNIQSSISDAAWHHLVFAVNRTYNNASLFLDDQMVITTSATNVPSIAGNMYFGGGGFEGNIDEFVVFEQALPKSLIEEYGNHSPLGDEMGLMAYLPFEQQVRNPNGILELVFSVNDRRIFKDPNGNTVDKKVPLVIENGTSKVPTFADKSNYAPVAGAGLLTPLHFDWAFNSDELMINLAMNDREINKQMVYITVRDVEDINGNPMPSPVTWLAYVDRNNLKWGEPEMQLYASYGEKNSSSNTLEMKILNNSGKRHQYTIESLPEWLKVSPQSGSMQPIENKTVTFTYSVEMPVGVYTDLIYLTDENGLSEPLRVELIIEAQPPYEGVDKGKYPYNMSLCGYVKIGDKYDTDSNDKIFAIYNNECIGMANVDFDAQTNKSRVFLTVYGNEQMSRKPVFFQLWQASTGKLYNLTADRNIVFAHGFVYGCGDGHPVTFTTNGSEIQNIALSAGWNWISTNLDLSATDGRLQSCVTAAKPWQSGDLIKNPATRKFSTYDPASVAFVGTLNSMHFSQMYMVNVKAENTMRIDGDKLHADSMTISVRGDGQWSVLPCMLNEVTPVAQALSDYYNDASTGDLIKAHNCFAYFSEDKKWEGDLTTLRPGEGYLFRRMAHGKVDIHFYNTPKANAPAKAIAQANVNAQFTNPDAATNMTMIAQVQGDEVQGTKVNVFIGDELVGMALPMADANANALYFLTIQSDQSGDLRFETEDGEALVPSYMDPSSINRTSYMSPSYIPDSHLGSLEHPVVLTPMGNTNAETYKIIENDHVVIIRNGEKYDVTGKKL